MGPIIFKGRESIVKPRFQNDSRYKQNWVEFLRLFTRMHQLSNVRSIIRHAIRIHVADRGIPNMLICRKHKTVWTDMIIDIRGIK